MKTVIFETEEGTSVRHTKEKETQGLGRMKK